MQPDKKITNKQKIAALIVATLLIVGIVLIFTLGKKDTPINNSIWNPYVVNWQYSYKSKFQATLTIPPGAALNTMPRQIPEGANNYQINSVSFEAGQLDRRTTYMTFTDDNWPTMQRYDVPTLQVNKPLANGFEELSLSMSGLQISNSPFGFQFTDPRNSSNVWMHTKNSNFIMMDKYLQIDL